VEWQQIASDMAIAADLTSTASNGQLDASDLRERFTSAMDNDLDTPTAITALVELSDQIREASGSSDVSAAQQTLRELGNILGLSLAA